MECLNQNPLHGVITDEILDEMKSRNELRLKMAIAYLGPKWLLYSQMNRTK